MEVEGGEELVIEKEHFRHILEVHRITNIREAQAVNLNKLLNQFFRENQARIRIYEDAQTLPDFESMNMLIFVMVNYIWNETGNKRIPKELDKIKVAPDEIKKELGIPEKLTVEMKADIVRYMRYLHQIQKL